MDDEPRAVYSAKRYENTTFDKHQKVNACVKLLLASFHGGYLWLECCIIVDSKLINRIIGLIMQGTDPHEYYLGKTTNCDLA
jgi:hypothetical protein